MRTAFECIPCLTRQLSEAVACCVRDPARRDTLMRELLQALATGDWRRSPPRLAQELHRRVREVTGTADPYRDLKARMNRMALDLLPAVRAAMALQPDPREAAIRAAIGGNLLDAGAKTQIAPEDLPRHMEGIFHHSFDGDATAFFHAAARARRILYLADNAGEIVFDRLLVEALPRGRVTVAVRGSPVINDATLADARMAGLTDIVPVISNGSDAPGTVLEDCSAEFRNAFAAADMIVAKGQGNWETLNEADAPLWFLLIVKCPAVAASAHAPVGTMVIRQRRA